MPPVHWDYVVMTGLWGALTSLERRAFLQAMISRPLVAGTVTGLFLHDTQAGLLIGVLFELLYLGGVSLGGAQSEHETLPTVAAAAMASAMGDEAGGGDATPAMLAISVLVFAPVGRLGRALEARLDRRASRYAARVKQAVEAGQLRRAVRQNLRALWPQFVFYGLLAGGAAFWGFMVAPFEPLVPLPILRGLAWAWPAMGVVAAGVALQGNRARGRFVWAGISAGLTLIIAFSAWYLGRPP